MRLPRPVLAVLLALALAACSSTATERSSAPSSPGALPSVVATPTGGRPLQTVPDVTVPGMVAAPAGSGVARYTTQHLDWARCGGRVDCATVRAPLDWADPDGRALTLTLGRISATALPHLGTLFVNPGGPGGSGLDYLGYIDTDGLQQYDIVSWDPRGVGQSTPVRCSDAASLDRYFSLDISPDDPAEAAAFNSASAGFGLDCLRNSGPLLQHVSTADTVKDLDLLRTLLGQQRLTYFGSSYGTLIGAAYAQEFPEHTGPMVLDGAVDLGDDSSVKQLMGFERALDHFAAWCAARLDCRLGSSTEQVLTSVKTLLGRLDQSPLPGRSQRRLTQQLGLEGILYPLYGGTSGWPALEKALETAVVDRDGRDLLAIADLADDRNSDGSYTQFVGAFPAIRCLDSQASSVTQAVRAAEALVPEAPVLGPYAGPDVLCPLWPVAPDPPFPAITAAGVSRPIVVIGTTGDPATPYEWAKETAAQLHSAVLITYAGEGHLAYDKSTCVRDLVRAYLVDAKTPAPNSRC